MNPVEEAELAIQEMELAGFLVTRRAEIPHKEQKDTVAYFKPKESTWKRAYLKYSNRCWQVGFPTKVDVQETVEAAPGNNLQQLISSALAASNDTYIWLEYGTPEAACKRIKRWLMET